MAHVFISYVRENSDVVDRLENELRNRGVTVWLDRNNIYPGLRWKDAIEKTIQSGNFFLACFSKEYGERDENYMNEELTIAVEKLRKRPSDKIWFIPVLINETRMPSRRISDVENLHDIQTVSLYKDWDAGISQILRVLRYDDPVLARIWKLLDILDEPFSSERRRAIEQLGNIGVAEKLVIAALIKATKDSDLKIKRASLKALGKIGPGAAEAVPALVAALKDPDKFVRERAVSALGEIGPGAAEAVPALVAALNPDDFIIQWSAATLREIGQAPPEEAAFFAAANPDCFIIPWSAINALGNIGPGAAEAVPALVAALKDPRLSPLHRRHPDDLWSAASALGMIGRDAVPALVAALSDEGIHGIAAYALAMNGQAAVPALEAALKDPDKSVRERAAKALAMIGQAAVLHLEAALKDPNKSVRMRAAKALL